MFFFKKKAPRDKKNILKKDGKDRKGQGIITGLIVGGAVGSVLSLLFAPARGSKTREKVAKQGKQLWQEGASKAEIFLDKYKNRIKGQIEDESKQDDHF